MIFIDIYQGVKFPDDGDNFYLRFSKLRVLFCWKKVLMEQSWFQPTESGQMFVWLQCYLFGWVYKLYISFKFSHQHFDLQAQSSTPRESWWNNLGFSRPKVAQCSYSSAKSDRLQCYIFGGGIQGRGYHICTKGLFPKDSPKLAHNPRSLLKLQSVGWGNQITAEVTCEECCTTGECCWRKVAFVKSSNQFCKPPAWKMSLQHSGASVAEFVIHRKILSENRR